MTEKKPASKLTTDDLSQYPVWQFTNADEERFDETVVKPIKKIPVKSLSGRIVGTQVTLADGTMRWAILENVDESNGRLTQHFLALSVFNGKKWFAMARYHDIDATTHGPAALAAFLRMAIESVFPISYDISEVCRGERSALVGQIESEPRERLTRAQIIGLAVPKLPKPEM